MPTTPNSQKREDEVLLRMLKTKPKPHTDMKGKKKVSPGKANESASAPRAGSALTTAPCRAAKWRESEDEMLRAYRLAVRQIHIDEQKWHRRIRRWWFRKLLPALFSPR